jgi:hypothetical protein
MPPAPPRAQDPRQVRRFSRPFPSWSNRRFCYVATRLLFRRASPHLTLTLAVRKRALCEFLGGRSERESSTAPYPPHDRLRAGDLNAKAPTCGAFAEPSNGLEPLTPSLPRAAKRLPRVATGCGSACFERFSSASHLPPVAPAGLHKCSIHSPAIADGQRPSGVSRVRVEC